MKIKNKKHPQKHFQKGSVLAISLILISLAAMITMVSMRASLMQEKMVSNENFKAISFTAAESGASSFTQWINDSSTVWNSNTWQNRIPTTATGNQNIGPMGYYWIDPNDVVWSASSVTLKVIGYAKSSAQAKTQATTTLQLTLTKPISSSGSSIQKYVGSGMISAGDINIKGKAIINGSAFANGNFLVTGGNSSVNAGTVSAAGKAEMSGALASNVISGVDKKTVPVVTDAWIAQMSSIASVKTCNINVTGDQGGKIFYCNGDAAISSKFSNATVVSSGNITKSGSSQLGGSGKDSTAVTVAIVAKGNINFKGSSNDYAVFWSNGDYNHNGSGSITGTIVTGGNMNRNGNFTFTNITQVQNDYIATYPPAPRGPSRVTLWKEILE